MDAHYATGCYRERGYPSARRSPQMSSVWPTEPLEHHSGWTTSSSSSRSGRTTSRSPRGSRERSRSPGKHSPVYKPRSPWQPMTTFSQAPIMAPLTTRAQSPFYSPGSPKMDWSFRAESPILVPEPLPTPQPSSPAMGQPPVCPPGSPTPKATSFKPWLDGPSVASPAPYIPGTPTPKQQQHQHQHQQQRPHEKLNVAYILCHQRPPFHYDEAIAAPRPVPPALTEQKVEETLTRWTAEVTWDDEQRAQAQEWESRNSRLVTHWNAPLQAPDRWPSPEPPVMRVADSEALRRVFTLEELQLEDEEREKTREYNIDMLEKTRRHHRWEEQEQQRQQEQPQQQQQQQQQQYSNGRYYEAPAAAVTASYQPPTVMEPSPHWGRWEELEQLEEQQQQPYGPFGEFPFAVSSFLPPIFRRWRPWEH